jgi:hypothetical protein
MVRKGLIGVRYMVMMMMMIVFNPSLVERVLLPTPLHLLLYLDTLQLVLYCKRQAIVHLLGLVLSYQHIWIVILSRIIMMTLIC